MNKPSNTPQRDREPQQPRDSHGHFLAFGDVPWAFEPDAWDDTCRHGSRPREFADGTPAAPGGAR